MSALPSGPPGAAMRARERKRRSTFRHVRWYMGLQQSALSHHTATAAGAPPTTAPGAAHDKVAAQVADLQDQVAALAHMFEDLRAAFLGQASAAVKVEEEADLETANSVEQVCKEEPGKKEEAFPECGHSPGLVELAAHDDKVNAISMGAEREEHCSTSAAGTQPDLDTADPDSVEAQRNLYSKIDADLDKSEKQIDKVEQIMSALEELHKPEAIRKELRAVNGILTREADVLDCMQLLGAQRDRRQVLLQRIDTLSGEVGKKRVALTTDELAAVQAEIDALFELDGCSQHSATDCNTS